MARADALDRLGSVPMFAACTRRELSQIARACDEIAVGQGSVIVEEGAAGHDFYLILEGRASVLHGSSEVASLGPGQFFGELSLLDGEPRNATVRAKTSMTLLVLGTREFSAVIDSWPGVARKMLVQMARRLRKADADAVSN